MKYVIKLAWDNEASVWIATSKDINGLILESGSYDALIERVRFAAPEILALNEYPLEGAELVFCSERNEKAYA